MANTLHPVIQSLAETRRTTERNAVRIAGRVTWRDSRGMTRFATVITKDVSEHGAYLECRGSQAIPLHRLVYLQLEREARDCQHVPRALRDGRVLSAVYRVGPSEPTTGTPSGYAVRLLVEPGAGYSQSEDAGSAARSIA